MRRALDSFFVFVVALALFTLFAQRTVYGVDGWVLLRRLSSGDLRSEMHLAFKPVAYVLIRVGESFGMSLYQAAVAACAACTAVGVALMHAALRVLGGSRRDGFLVAAGVALCPGVFFFATVLERHGVFFLGAGLAALASAWFARRPSVGSAAAAGAAIVAAYALHSTGAFLTTIDLPLAVALARILDPTRSWSRLLGLGGISFVVAAIGCVLARKAAVLLGLVEQEGASFEFFLVHAKAHLAHPEMIAGALWQEVVLPFLPFSIFWLAIRRAPSRSAAAATGVGVIAYGLLSYLMLGDFGERGAYSLPLALPFVALTLTALGRRFGSLSILLAAVLAISEIRNHDQHPTGAIAQGIRELAGERPFLLPAAPIDFETIYVDFPGLRPTEDYWDAFDAKGFHGTLVRDNAAFLTGGYLGQKASSGRILLMSASAVAELEKPVDPGQAGPLVLEVLRERFRFEPVHVAGFEGFRLVPRP
ncbi:MAG: hypothetical protein U1F36_08035 [Planctomycetota bacterium]